MYLFIKNWDYKPMPGENPNHIIRVFTVNGEVALPEPLPSVVDPRYEKTVEDGNPSLSQKTDFTVSDPGNNPPWDLVTTFQPNLKTIIVQDGVTEIPENFFYKEGGLTVDKIVLPTTITGILSKAFKGCTTTIEYAGSPNMWNAIDRVDDWDEDANINITYLMFDAVEPAPNM